MGRLLGWQLLILIGLGVTGFSAGCTRVPQDEVVVYTALDREFSEAIFADFQRTTGIRVRAKYDTEANKSVGLANLLLNEQSQPRCDLFWNNEILNTLRLERAQLLRAYATPRAVDYPDEFQSSDDRWYGFAARARVLLVNRDAISDGTGPRSIRELADPRWRGRAGMAKPLFGTTATHAACLFAAWGSDEATRYFRQVRDNAHILPGNRQVAQAVGRGQLAFGLTDTDDAILEIEQGRPVEIVYPDQEPGGLGTLLIPNTLALIAGSPHPEQAQRLLNYLLSSAVEDRLAQGPSAQIPLNRRSRAPSRVAPPATVRPMQVDFERAADGWDQVSVMLRDLYLVD